MLTSCFFVKGGTEGLFAQKTLEITEEVLSSYKNQGVLKIGSLLTLNDRKLTFIIDMGCLLC